MMTAEQLKWCQTLNGNCIQCKFNDVCEMSRVEKGIDTVKRYTKKPVVIEAVQWTGLNHDEIKQFCPTARFNYCDAAWEVGVGPVHTLLIIPTLEGDHYANYGDYIIKGVAGEFYPCKPDIFAKTYDAEGGNEV